VFDKDLRQLVDPVLNQHVARAGDSRRSMRHVVNRRTNGRRAFFREHSRNRSRRSDLPGKTLHKNCPYLRRLDAIRETIDGFGFQTCPTAHFNPIGEGQKNGTIDTFILRHNVSQPAPE
jgi:hypothetical protein